MTYASISDSSAPEDTEPGSRLLRVIAAAWLILSVLGTVILAMGLFASGEEMPAAYWALVIVGLLQALFIYAGAIVLHRVDRRLRQVAWKLGVVDE